jgi:hypothetical protein
MTPLALRFAFNLRSIEDVQEAYHLLGERPALIREGHLSPGDAKIEARNSLSDKASYPAVLKPGVVLTFSEAESVSE